jgi:NAD(P)H-dependent FMN reductase
MTTVAKPTLHVVVASTRPGRRGPLVGAWFLEQARRHGAFDVELVELADMELPLLDEPAHPRLGDYEHEHTRAWSAVVDRADAYVFVTPEYDHGAPASLVNALQYLVREWAYKAAGFVSYGGVSAGTRGVQMAKQLLAALRMMPVPDTVAIPFFARHIDGESGAFDPGEVQEQAARVMLDELLRWTTALRPLRRPVLAAADDDARANGRMAAAR